MLRILCLSMAILTVAGFAPDGRAEMPKVVGVRGSGLELYADAGLGQVAGKLSRSEVTANIGAIEVVDHNPDALKIAYAGKQFWVKRGQIRLDRPTDYATDCSQKLAGVSAGASRGIGGSCKP